MKPLRADNPIYAEIKRLALRMETWFNAGHPTHGRMGWFLMMAILMVPTALIYWVLKHYNWFLAAFAWNVLIVYLTLGFRHYSHYFTSIQLALNAGDDATARALLAEWDPAGHGRHGNLRDRPHRRRKIADHHAPQRIRRVLLVPDAAGPRLRRHVPRVRTPGARGGTNLNTCATRRSARFAARAFYWIDWIPVRLTAVAFAVVGNFEDAIYAWRNFAHRWADEAIGIILTAGGGAMGVRLGTPAENAAKVLPVDAAAVDASDEEPEVLPGEEPNVRALQSTVGLVWRALLLWMMLLLLLSGAVWLGAAP